MLFMSSLSVLSCLIYSVNGEADYNSPVWTIKLQLTVLYLYYRKRETHEAFQHEGENRSALQPHHSSVFLWHCCSDNWWVIKWNL